jgi:3-hydroxyacyl-CoA dehydrogenase
MIDIGLWDGILKITMNGPPVNALGVHLRRAIANAIDEAQENTAVLAIVITGSGKYFSAGADINEFDEAFLDPSLPDVIGIIEASRKPVVAAINGFALGGGLEVALGCHYRLAVEHATLGLPEVNLGLLPGAGGTQRLPRIVGAEIALELIVSGAPISGTKAAGIGLVDQLSDGSSLIDDVVSFARSVQGPRRTGALPIAVDVDAFERTAAALRAKSKTLVAPKACIEAVRAAAELPISEGLAIEQRLFRELVAGDQSKALRHVFFAERASAKVEGLPGHSPLRSIESVGVIGAGTMGGGISMNFLSGGVPVTIVETSQEALDRGVAIIRKNYEASASKGRLTPDKVERAMGLLTPTLGFEALGRCDLVIEAIYENMEAKKAVFERLNTVAKPGAILASNTSFLSIDEIASVTSRPHDVLGLHFFSPANVMRLLEVVRGEKTASDTLATAMHLARRIAKVPVVARVCYGFIGNRMLLPRQDNAHSLLVEGATPQQIDLVHTSMGMPMGPFQMSDLAGVDIGWHRDPTRIGSLQDALCAQGRWGQKTNAGFYDYDQQRRATPSAAVAAIIEDFRARAGGVPRAISEDEIIARTLYTMVNEGAKILEEGIAQRASDIDIVWIYGYGWPRHKGGPMFWADQIGLATIVRELTRYAAAMGNAFTLSPLLEKCAAEGRPLDR